MADIIGAYIKQVAGKKGKKWRGTLVIDEPNPEYVPDPRPEGSRRRSWGTKPNPSFVEDPREEGQRKKTVQRQITKTFGATVKTKGEAQAVLATWRAEVTAELEIEAKTGAKSGTTIAEHMKAMNLELRTTQSVEPSTLKGYEKNARAIAAEWPNVRLDELTPKMVEKWRDGMLDRGLSAVTAKKHFNYLRMVYKNAIAKRLVDWSPCDAVKPPRVSKKAAVSLPPSEARRLVALLDASELTDMSMGAYLAYYAGMRQGEVCGLRWCDVDFDNCVVTVAHSIGIDYHGTTMKSPKTESSHRDIPAPPQLMEVLARRRSAMISSWREARLALMEPATDEDFGAVFVCGGIDGRPKTPAVLSREWASFARQFGITNTKGERATFHCLRHNYASLLIADGISHVTLAKRMGHSKPSMTLDVYAAEFAEREKSAARPEGERIGRAFEKVAAREPAEVLPFQAASNE